MEKVFPVVIEKCKETGLLVGYVPGVPGAHTQAESIDELMENMKDVLKMVLEENPHLSSDFVGLQTVSING